MATETPFLKLRKPATSDLVDVRQDIVHNLDTIDRYAGEPIMEPWKEFRNPLSNVPYNVIRCKYKLLGNVLLYQGNCNILGAATGSITINFPPGMEASTNMQIGGTNSVGSVIGVAAANSGHTGAVCLFLQSGETPSGGFRSIARIRGNMNASALTWNATVPFTWSSTSVLSFHIQVEVGLRPNGL